MSFTSQEQQNCDVGGSAPAAAGNQGPQENAGELEAYRSVLVERSHKANESYDKAVMALSSGALAVSLTFLHDIVPHPRASSVFLLGAAWLLLVLSLVAIFASLLTSQFAFRTAITQVDSGIIQDSRAGGLYASITVWLNVASGALFVFGLASLMWFALTNI